MLLLLYDFSECSEKSPLENYLWPLVMINSNEMYTVQLGLMKFRGEFGV